MTPSEEVAFLAFVFWRHREYFGFNTQGHLVNFSPILISFCIEFPACFRNYQFHLTVIELRISLKCGYIKDYITCIGLKAVSYTHLRAHETRHDLVCRLLLEKKKKKKTKQP